MYEKSETRAWTSFHEERGLSSRLASSWRWNLVAHFHSELNAFLSSTKSSSILDSVAMISNDQKDRIEQEFTTIPTRFDYFTRILIFAVNIFIKSRRNIRIFIKSCSKTNRGIRRGICIVVQCTHVVQITILLDVQILMIHKIWQFHCALQSRKQRDDDV